MTAYNQLTFVRLDDAGQVVDWWLIEETGDWSKDNQTGRDAAESLMRMMFFTDAPVYLGYVVKAIIAKGRYGGIEVGFFTAFAELACKSGLDEVSSIQPS